MHLILSSHNMHICILCYAFYTIVVVVVDTSVTGGDGGGGEKRGSRIELLSQIII